MPKVWIRGATAYEVQIGRLCVRVCHLKGAYWSWKPWRRVKIWIEPNPNPFHYDDMPHDENQPWP